MITQKNETKQIFDNLCNATKTKAERAAKGFHGFLKQTLDSLIAQGQQLNQLRATMQRELGKKKGNAAFKHWLNAEQWQLTRNMADTAMVIAKKYEQLPGKLKSQLRDKLSGWSTAAIKELLRAGTEVLRKLMHRPTCSAARVRELKKQLKEKERLQQPVSDWAKVQTQYQDLTAEALQAIKEEAERKAHQQNRAVLVQDVEKVADEFGYQKVKPRKTTAAPLKEIKERIANYAIRRARLEEAYYMAPEEMKDNLALQIQSCKSQIAKLSKELEAESHVSPEETSPTQPTQDQALLQRIADLEALVQTLHQQNEQLIAKNSHSEPAPNPTIETLEQKIQEQDEAIASLKKQNEELEKKLGEATIEIKPTQPYSPTNSPKLEPTKTALTAIGNKNCDLQTLEQNPSR